MEKIYSCLDGIEHNTELLEIRPTKNNLQILTANSTMIQAIRVELEKIKQEMAELAAKAEAIETAETVELAPVEEMPEEPVVIEKEGE